MIRLCVKCIHHKLHIKEIQQMPYSFLESFRILTNYKVRVE
ncbi:Hypothetical protein BN2458_PEG0107 [Helicobacter typhlonius]|uniref:Uncharacterized protein n=1 Tax=Helicobacter typhlonius TaxID=76936 RepID=A0A0S4PUU8_9HELI|nr:Hypothetical protein BN2458_PEG0107 [Helicobacter typhlonius]